MLWLIYLFITCSSLRPGKGLASFHIENEGMSRLGKRYSGSKARTPHTVAHLEIRSKPLNSTLFYSFLSLRIPVHSLPFTSFDQSSLTG